MHFTALVLFECTGPFNSKKFDLNCNYVASECYTCTVQDWASSGFFLKGSGFCVSVRACMYIPPISVNGQCVSFRKFFKAFVAWPLRDVTKIM